MKILIISQVYWPDSTAVSQHLTDFSEELARRNHEVQVLTSRANYENPDIRYAKKETRGGVGIERLWQTGFAKASRLGRLLNFASFNLSLCCRLLFLPRGRYHAILGLTSPPLVSFFGVIAAKLKRAKFYYWTMDLQPELAILTGYLRRDSLAAKLLQRMGDYIFKQADRILALDRYMADYIVKRGAQKEKIQVNAVWPIMQQVYDGPLEENPFRREHGLNNKIVVMYSGNHAVVHPLDTLLGAALLLRDDPRFVFVFIGGGVRKQEVTQMKTRHGLANILQLPYQELGQIHLSLGAADLHAVIHGNGCTGLTHPNKIYGAMFVGRPVAYIGPAPSHIADILAACPGNIAVEHGQAEALVEELLRFAGKTGEERSHIGANNSRYAQAHFERQQLINNLIAAVEQ